MNITNWIGRTTLHNGPKRRSSWNLDIGWHSDSWARATLVNAAAEYDYQRRVHGIQDPFDRPWIFGRLNIRAVFKEGNGSH